MSHAKSVKSFDRTEIYYEVSHGPQKKKFLVFLHGLGAALNAWDPERTALQNLGYSTIAIDLRGHGLSGRPTHEDAYGFDYFAYDVLEVLRNEKAEGAILIGHCFGGMVALTVEGTYANTSKGLILVDTSYKPPFFVAPFVNHPLLNTLITKFAAHLPQYSIAGHANFLQYKNTPDIHLQRILSDILHTSLKSYLLLCEALVSYDATTLLKKILVPTEIIQGTNDSIIPPSTAQDLHHRIKKSYLEFVPGANHILVTSNPKDLVKDIERFLKKIRF